MTAVIDFETAPTRLGAHCIQRLGPTNEHHRHSTTCYQDAAYGIWSAETREASYACKAHLPRAVDLIMTVSGSDVVTVHNLR